MNGLILFFFAEMEGHFIAKLLPPLKIHREVKSRSSEVLKSILRKMRRFHFQCEKIIASSCMEPLPTFFSENHHHTARRRVFQKPFRRQEVS